MMLTQSRDASTTFPGDKTGIQQMWSGLCEMDAVCFDVDSTVVTGEFIDELASFLNVGTEVQNVTKKAMGGNMGFREALKERLGIMKPSLESIEKFKEDDKLILSDGVRELISVLHKRKVDLYLVSGGFELLINPVADKLQIPRENVFANALLFSKDGSYMSFDESRPTSQSGGKGRAIATIMERKKYRHVIMVGDGATDAEASPPANAFIGFGGNAERVAVRDSCNYYVYHFQELLDLL